MRLPNGAKAVVDIIKLREYCLNESHPEGRHKARVFRAALNLGRNDAALLQSELLVAARDNDAVASEADGYGQRFVLDFSVKHGRRKALIRSAWIIRKGEDFPRLTTCYVLGEVQ